MARLGPQTLPASTLIEEELNVEYNSKKFYPVNTGDIYKEKYEILFKLGYGRSSTVWLAENVLEYACYLSFTLMVWLNIRSTESKNLTVT